MELNNTVAVFDLEVVLYFYNKVSKLTGSTKRYKMDDEFFTAFMKEMNRIKSEGVEMKDFVLAEA